MVTGRPDGAGLEFLGAVRYRFQAISLVLIADEPVAAPAGLGGVTSVTARTAAEFAAVWNERVRR